MSIKHIIVIFFISLSFFSSTLSSLLTNESKGLNKDRFKKDLESETSFNGRKRVYRIKGIYNIRGSVFNAVFICDSITKINIIGDKVIIDNCVFNANSNSVDRSLIDCLGKEVIIKNCVVKNIRGNNKNGAYGIFVDIEKCSSSIMSCIFKNISDSREETDPVGEMKGMCGAIFYSCSKCYLKSVPYNQKAEDIIIENVFTSLPNGEVNEKSTDADGLRVFINEKKTQKEFFDAQKYTIRNIRGRDLQKRLLKISGATNCVISNVVYKKNKKLSKRFPSNLIAVYDSDNIYISDVDYSSGCSDIAFCGINSHNINIDNIIVKDNKDQFGESTSSLFRINSCEHLAIRNLRFMGHYYRLGQLYNSEDVEIQLKGEDVSCTIPMEIKDSKDVKITGLLRNLKKDSNLLFKIVNVEGLSIDERLGKFMISQYSN